MIRLLPSNYHGNKIIWFKKLILVLDQYVVHSIKVFCKSSNLDRVIKFTKISFMHYKTFIVSTQSEAVNFTVSRTCVENCILTENILFSFVLIGNKYGVKLDICKKYHCIYVKQCQLAIIRYEIVTNRKFK